MLIYCLHSLYMIKHINMSSFANLLRFRLFTAINAVLLHCITLKQELFWRRWSKYYTILTRAANIEYTEVMIWKQLKYITCFTNYRCFCYFRFDALLLLIWFCLVCRRGSCEISVFCMEYHDGHTRPQIYYQLHFIHVHVYTYKNLVTAAWKNVDVNTLLRNDSEINVKHSHIWVLSKIICFRQAYLKVIYCNVTFIKELVKVRIN